MTMKVVVYARTKRHPPTDTRAAGTGDPGAEAVGGGIAARAPRPFVPFSRAGTTSGVGLSGVAALDMRLGRTLALVEPVFTVGLIRADLRP